MSAWMGVSGFIRFCFLFAYLNWLIGLPLWATIVILVVYLCLFNILPVGIFSIAVLNGVALFASLLFHIYTVIFAFAHAWWKGILTTVLPGMSQVYWFIVDAGEKGFRESLFCTLVLWLVLGRILKIWGKNILLERTARATKAAMGEI